MSTDRQRVSHLGAELVDLSILVAGDDELSQRSPHSTRNLVVAARYRQVGLVVLCSDRDRQREREAIFSLLNIFLNCVIFQR